MHFHVWGSHRAKFDDENLIISNESLVGTNKHTHSHVSAYVNYLKVLRLWTQKNTPSPKTPTNKTHHTERKAVKAQQAGITDLYLDEAWKKTQAKRTHWCKYKHRRTHKSTTLWQKHKQSTHTQTQVSCSGTGLYLGLKGCRFESWFRLLPLPPTSPP